MATALGQTAAGNLTCASCDARDERECTLNQSQKRCQNGDVCFTFEAFSLITSVTKVRRGCFPLSVCNYEGLCTSFNSSQNSSVVVCDFHCCNVSLCNSGNLTTEVTKKATTFGATTMGPTTAGETTMGTTLTTDEATTMETTTDGATTMGPKPDGATTMGAKTDGATTMGITTNAATTMGSTTAGETTMEPKTDGATTMGTTTNRATTIGPTTAEETTMGPKTDGATTMGTTTNAATTMGPTTAGETTMGTTLTTDGATTMETTTDGATTTGPEPDGATTMGPTTDGKTTAVDMVPTTAPPSVSGIPTTIPRTTLSPVGPEGIRYNVTVTEQEDVTLNCTASKEAASPKWSREDGEAVQTQWRVLKDEDSKLRITSASVRDAGIFICQLDKIKHIFNVSVKVIVEVEMVIRVLNYQYTPELLNKSSIIFKETEKNFTAEMDKVYKNTPGYFRTEVLNFTKGSVKVDFRVIIIIVATDPKNESTITDKKAETGQTILRKAETGFVERLKVSPDIEIKAPPPEPRDVTIFDLKSNELSVRWIPPEDLKAFNVKGYRVQHRRFQMKDVSTNDIPASEGRDKYSYRIQNLEPETTYMISVAAVNNYGDNFNEETGHLTHAAPIAEWIIALIVLGVMFVIAIIIGGIACFRRRAAERRRRQAEESALEGFGSLTLKELDSALRYEERNVKGLKYSFVNDPYKPSEVNWTEIPYENINLMDQLGSGAFGVVYRGEIIREKDDVTPCAVKALKASASDEEIRDLYNELEIMTNVGYHPNLVNLLGACKKDGNLLVVLEIAENGSLLDFLKKSRNGNENYQADGISSGGLAENMKLRIATDVAKGMACLASHRCIHRDLAARNVLLGENYVAKVADYGMARDVYESLMYKKETQGLLPVKWMAIESLETFVFTVQSDIWSYGVLLWEIESGGLKPYAGLTTPEMMAKLKNGYRLEKPCGCSDAMYQVMRDCWNPNPKLRPSFERLVERLEAMSVLCANTSGDLFGP